MKKKKRPPSAIRPKYGKAVAPSEKENLEIIYSLDQLIAGACAAAASMLLFDFVGSFGKSFPLLIMDSIRNMSCFLYNVGDCFLFKSVKDSGRQTDTLKTDKPSASVENIALC